MSREQLTVGSLAICHCADAAAHLIEAFVRVFDPNRHRSLAFDEFFDVLGDCAHHQGSNCQAIIHRPGSNDPLTKSGQYARLSITLYDE